MYTSSLSMGLVINWVFDTLILSQTLWETVFSCGQHDLLSIVCHLRILNVWCLLRLYWYQHFPDIQIWVYIQANSWIVRRDTVILLKSFFYFEFICVLLQSYIRGGIFLYRPYNCGISLVYCRTLFLTNLMLIMKLGDGRYDRVWYFTLCKTLNKLAYQLQWLLSLLQGLYYFS